MAKYRDSMIAVMVTFLICNGLAVSARLYSRWRLTRSFGADDALLCLTYVSPALNRAGQALYIKVN